MQLNLLPLRRILNDEVLRTRVKPLPEFVKTILCTTLLLCLLAALTVSAQPGKTIKRPTTQGSVHIQVVESSEGLQESLLEKPALQFSSSQPANLTIRVDE